jgi:hypothetical protein
MPYSSRSHILHPTSPIRPSNHIHRYRENLNIPTLQKKIPTHIVPNIIRIIRPQLILSSLILRLELVRRHRFGIRLDDRALGSAHFDVATDRIVGMGRRSHHDRRRAKIVRRHLCAPKKVSRSNGPASAWDSYDYMNGLEISGFEEQACAQVQHLKVRKEVMCGTDKRGKAR